MAAAAQLALVDVEVRRVSLGGSSSTVTPPQLRTAHACASRLERERRAGLREMAHLDLRPAAHRHQRQVEDLERVARVADNREADRRAAPRRRGERVRRGGAACLGGGLARLHAARRPRAADAQRGSRWRCCEYTACERASEN